MARRRRDRRLWVLMDLSGDPGCEYNNAVVTLTAGYVRMLLDEIAAVAARKEAQPDFYCEQIRDSVEAYRDTDVFGTGADLELESGDFMLLGAEPVGYDLPVGGDARNVTGSTVYWTCYPKHHDGPITLESTSLGVEPLRMIWRALRYGVYEAGLRPVLLPSFQEEN